jgi:hypothetical protein
VGRARDRLKRRLTALGARLERGLAIVRAFEAPSIQVTGLVDEAGVAQGAAAISAALALRGRRVACRLPAGAAKPVILETLAGSRLRFADDDTGDGSQKAIRVRCLPPVSADLDLAEAARRSPALVCIVPSAEVAEAEVRSFQERSIAAGLIAFSVVILES